MPRPRIFSEDELLDAAVELFWARGYRSSSLAELSAQTRVTNGSLYQAYGNKWGLFLAAYRRYCAQRVEVVAGVFSIKRGGIEQTVNAYFDAIIDDCLSHPDRRGCLMLNTIAEFGTDSDVAAISGETIRSMEEAVERALTALASPASAEDIGVSAAHVVALSQALIQLSRVGREPSDLRRIGSQAAASVELALLAA